MRNLSRTKLLRRDKRVNRRRTDWQSVPENAEGLPIRPTRNRANRSVAASKPALRRTLQWLAVLIVALAWTSLKAADPPGGSVAKTAPKDASAGKADPALKAAIDDVASTLDQAIAKAVEHNPDIVAAKAKLALAEAELNSTRMEVARKVIALWNERQGQKAERDRVWEMQKSVPNSVSRENLIAAEARLAQSENELGYLTGRAVPGVTRLTRSQAAAKPPQMPRGPLAEKIRQALNSPTQQNFVDEALENVLDYSQDLHKIEIHRDWKALEGEGIAVGGEKITMNTKGAPLAAALQLLEDQHPPLKFVVRDYGVFVTTSKRAEEEGFLSVVEFAHLSEGDETAAPSKASEPAGLKTSMPEARLKARPGSSTEPRRDPFAPDPPKRDSRQKSPAQPKLDPFAP